MRFLQEERGFSLIEVVVATTILVVVLIPMLATLLRSHQIIYAERDRITAQNLVTQAVEELQAKGCSGMGLKEIPLVKEIDDPNSDARFELSESLKERDGNLNHLLLEVNKDGKTLAQLDFLLYDGEERN